jgi:multidrug efflux pump subunit AcrA (membrane-fusion protein)
MSRTASRGREEAGQRDGAVAAGKTGQARPDVRRLRTVTVVLVLVVLGAGAGIAGAAGAFRTHGSSGTGQGAPAPATQPVLQENLSSQLPVTATLGYADSYPVHGQGGGTLTWLPSQGQVIGQGQVLYRVDNGVPVVLLYGAVPAWRTLDEGLTGADVTQLNHDLVALGYASRSDISALGWDYFSWETAYGVQQLESALGVSSPPGSLPLGSVVFEPAAIRVSDVLGSLGGPGAGPVLAATSDQHVVTIPLSTSQESEVAAGDPVTVTLPDNASTPGRISSVGTVASGPASNATIQVTVTLTHPSVAGTLDQAPVTVYITTASVSNALAVPVAALVAQSSGGYAVEVIGAGNTRRLVPVTVGIFDDDSGLVQVTGALTPGEQVVVPAT